LADLGQVAPVGVAGERICFTVGFPLFSATDDGESFSTATTSIFATEFRLDLATPLHRGFDSEFLLHGDDRLEDVEVEELGEEFVDKLNADSLRLTDVRHRCFVDRVVVNGNLLLDFEETVRDRVVGLILDFLIQLFDKVPILLGHCNDSVWILVQESTQLATLCGLFERGD